MTVLDMSLLVWTGSLFAGFFGALTGLGGGVIIIPMLTLAFGVDIRYAAGASLVSIIATSSGAAAAYVREGFTNIRVAMFLEIATTFGALLGAFLAARLPTSAIAVIFGLVLIYSAILSRHPPKERGAKESGRFATILKMDSDYPTAEGRKGYHVGNVPAGFGIMFIAGGLSGLLGIGSGAVKVLAMDRAMKLPFKVSTTTSNFMIGVTAAASAGAYLHGGFIDPGLAMPVMLGVLPGSWFGAKVLYKTKPVRLRMLFSLVILALAVEMIYNGLKGNL